MKIDIKKILASLEPAKLLFNKYRNFIALIFVLVIFGFIFYRIGYFNNLEPSEQNIEEKIQTIQRPKIDTSIVEKLENLEQQNIPVQALFNQARENPFNE